MSKLKKFFTNIRIIIALIFLLMAVIAIYPNPTIEGVAIRSVMQNSSASIAGIQNPNPATRPMSRERVLAINNREVKNIRDYDALTSNLNPNTTLMIKTNKGNYRVFVREKIQIIALNETELRTITEEKFDEALNKTINTTKKVLVNKTLIKSEGAEDIGLRVYNAPTTNIKKGLELEGGTRVLLQPEEKISKDYTSDLISNMRERLNVYGLTDIVVKEASDLAGNQFVLVEIAGANEEEVKDLLSKQGKFEAKVSNKSVFKGGKDITYVCKSADCSGIDPRGGCYPVQGGYACRFRFSISLSPEAAQKQADATNSLEVISAENQEYLSQDLELFLDDRLVDKLKISADLKGRAVTDIEISGSGFGANQQQATFNALQNMKKLQTVLITGSLPVKLNIVRTDNISPVLGEEFIKNAVLIGIIAVLVVAAIIYIRYRRLKIAIPIIFNSAYEVVLLLGFAALVGWNLDLASIAGIIVVIGTGVDDLIVIADEILRGERTNAYDWKTRMKMAFFIIMSAYLATVAAMLPLMFAGAGMLKGFAIVTIVGVSFGVFLARPAYAAVIELLLKD